MNKNLVVFEMANNHMGDIAHGVNLIREFGQVVSAFKENFEFAFKLQYRNLDTFIHSSVRGDMSLKYVKRFEETRLREEDFIKLLDTMKECGFKRICTPFDEDSVGVIGKHGIEVIKIASCSFTDWPLLERIAKAEKPVIASTAGADLEDIDRVVSFFIHRAVQLTIMHCVAEYPTPDENLRLARIPLLKERYPDIRIGYSTHEHPNRTEPVMLAVAMGAKVFEKHVALPNDKYEANGYSATPEQIQSWLEALSSALVICGPSGYAQPSETERKSLQSLRRGVFAIKPIRSGHTIVQEDIEFAFPPVDGQITANDWSKYAVFKTTTEIPAGQPVLLTQVESSSNRVEILDAVRSINKLLNKANVIVPGKADLEVSHHYGMEKFNEYGLTMITVVNREYCKKLLILLPQQEHPEQYHNKKEETFVILHGEIDLWLDDQHQKCSPGDAVTITPGVRHRFSSQNGVVLEEISSTHYKDDSFYTDSSIMGNTNRKTFLTYWMNA
jgi:sialic acid synthase SpsE/mannose-6-phosphate isomerase-like protein (cupin superfamily)